MTQEEQAEEQQKQKILSTFNMAEIDAEIDKDSKYVTMSSGDKKTFKFDPTLPIDKVESVFEGKPTIRYQLRVLDVNTGTTKLWTVSKTLLQQINDYVKEEIYTLTIQRKGTSTETRYMIKPVMDQQA